MSEGEERLRQFRPILEQWLVDPAKVTAAEKADLLALLDSRSRRPDPTKLVVSTHDRLRYPSMRMPLLEYYGWKLKTKSGSMGCTLSTMHSCCGVLHVHGFEWFYAIEKSVPTAFKELLTLAEEAAGASTFGTLFATHYEATYGAGFAEMGWEEMAFSDAKKMFYNPNSGHDVKFWVKRINQRNDPPTKWPLGVREPLVAEEPKVTAKAKKVLV